MRVLARRGLSVARIAALTGVLVGIPGARSLARPRIAQCKRSCGASIASCLADGGRARHCRRTVWKRCHRQGLGICLPATTTTTLPACLPVTGSGETITTYEGSAATDVALASFAPPGGVQAGCAYIADIAWGDGADSPGTVTPAGSGFTVTGSHTYADEGSYPITVVLTSGGGRASIGATAVVLEALLVDGMRGTPTQRWINELYTDLLHRPADPGGLAHWGNVIRDGGRAAVATGVVGSPGYRSVHVQAIYQQLLGRPASDPELTQGVQLLGAGGTFEQLHATILGSDEYFAGPGGDTYASFVTALYRDLLGRGIDPAALAAIVTQLASGTPRSSVAASVLSSPEYFQYLVRGAYQQLLHRPADPAGLSSWVNVLLSGGRDETVVAGLVASDEYFNRTAP